MVVEEATEPPVIDHGRFEGEVVATQGVLYSLRIKGTLTFEAGALLKSLAGDVSVSMPGSGQLAITAAGTLTVTAPTIIIGAAAKQSQFTSNGDLQVFRRIAPGNQATRYVDDDGAAFLRVVGGGLDISAVTQGMKYVVTTGGASGALPSPTRYITFQDAAGNVRYMPVFTNFNPWSI